MTERARRTHRQARHAHAALTLTLTIALALAITLTVAITLALTAQASAARKAALAQLLSQENASLASRRDHMRHTADAGVTNEQQGFTKEQAAYRRFLADRSDHNHNHNPHSTEQAAYRRFLADR